MAFEYYITYQEYVELGGIVPELLFPVYERKARRWVDYITFNRIKYLTVIPDEVKEVCTEYMNKLYQNDVGAVDASGAKISSYSNGVEKITYSVQSKKDIEQELKQFAAAWLPDYLICRSVNFDVEKYLQSDNNNSEQTEENG